MTNHKLLFLLLPLVPLLIIAPSLSYAQQHTNKTWTQLQGELQNLISSPNPPPNRSINHIGTEKSLRGDIDAIMRHANSAELHGNMTAHNMYVTQNNVLVCIINTLLVNDTSGLGLMNAQNCDETIVGNIVHNDLGNNETIIAMAKEYLKVRGIQ